MPVAKRGTKGKPSSRSSPPQTHTPTTPTDYNTPTHTHTAPLCAKRFSPHLSALILRMLDKRREVRPTMEEVLAHPVFAHYPHLPPAAFTVGSYAPPPQYLPLQQPHYQQLVPPPMGAVAYAQAQMQAQAAAYGATGAGEVLSAAVQQQQQQVTALVHAQRAAQLQQQQHHQQLQLQQLQAGGGVHAMAVAAPTGVAMPPPGPVAVGAPVEGAVAVDVEAAEDDDDIIEPVLPDLALQVR